VSGSWQAERGTWKSPDTPTSMRRSSRGSRRGCLCRSSLCVYATVWEHLKNQMSKLYQFFMHVARGHGSVLFWRRCVRNQDVIISDFVGTGTISCIQLSVLRYSTCRPGLYATLYFLQRDSMLVRYMPS